MRTRNHDWIDTSNGTALYSFQVYADGRWCNPAKGGIPLMFKTTAARDAARAEARKQPTSHGAGEN